ncbi:unnamed protein product [Boreogadus saida]
MVGMEVMEVLGVAVLEIWRAPQELTAVAGAKTHLGGGWCGMCGAGAWGELTGVALSGEGRSPGGLGADSSPPIPRIRMSYPMCLVTMFRR